MYRALHVQLSQNSCAYFYVWLVQRPHWTCFSGPSRVYATRFRCCRNRLARRPMNTHRHPLSKRFSFVVQTKSNKFINTQFLHLLQYAPLQALRSTRCAPRAALHALRSTRCAPRAALHALRSTRCIREFESNQNFSMLRRNANQPSNNTAT